MNIAHARGRLAALCLLAGALSACTLPAGQSGTRQAQASAQAADLHAAHGMHGGAHGPDAKAGCACCKGMGKGMGDAHSAGSCMAPAAKAAAGHGAHAGMAMAAPAPAQGGHAAPQGASGPMASLAGSGACCADMPCCKDGSKAVSK